MSALHILGWICMGIGALSLAALVVVLILAAAYDWQQKRADKATEYEASAYGPMRNTVNRLCELRGHDYHLNADGTHWVCVRGDDKVARLAISDELADLDDIENYANGGVA